MNIRAMEPTAGDRAFVARSWLESFASSAIAEGLTFCGIVKHGRTPWTAGPSYWRCWNPLVDRLIDRSHTLIAEDRGLIAGFMVWEPWEDAACVHYVYTRLSYRGQGVARQLMGQLPAGPIIFTHRARGVRQVPESWRFSMAPLFDVHEKVAA